tara:strand:- start:3670 stop:5439 length:1770 start_codon:yes stop_codon:yes gene_type:complete
MDRGSTGAFQTEIVKSANKPFHLVKLSFDDVSYFLSDAYIPVTYDSDTYTPTGSFLAFSDIVETNEANIETISISLSGVDTTYINLFLAGGYLDRTVQIYKAFLDSNDALVSDPLLIFDGRLNNPVIKEDVDAGTSTIAVQASSLFVDFDRINTRFTNNESQQSFFDGDTGFRFSSVVVKELNWGMTTGATASGGGSSSVSTQGTTTSPINNTSPAQKSIFREIQPTNPAFSLQSGSVVIHINYANRSTTNFSVGQQVKINGFESKTFDDGEFILSSAINHSEGAGTHAITSIDSDGFGFTIAVPNTVTSLKSGKFGGSEITVDDELVAPVLIETTSGSNSITVNADNFAKVDEAVSFNLETSSVGGISSSVLSLDHKITARTTDTLTVAVTQKNIILANALKTTSGSTSLVIDFAEHNIAVSDSITISGATAVGGVPASDINKAHTVTAITANTVTVVVSTTATSSARGGSDAVRLDGKIIRTNPIETTSSSATVKVHYRSHGLANSDTITLEGLDDVGGLDRSLLNKSHTVIDASNADHFTITLSESATASEFGGGGDSVLERPVKATSTVNYGSSGSRINLPTEIR